MIRRSMFHTPGNSNSTNPRGLASASVCSINQDINHDINQHPRDQDAQFCHLVGARKGLQLQANSPPGRGHGDIFYQKSFHGLRISAPFQCSMDGNDEQEFPSHLSWVIKCPHFSHHPTIRYMVYNGYYKVMSNIPKMGHLPTPVHRYLKFQPFRLKRASPAEFAEPLSTSAGTAFSGLVPGRNSASQQRHWLVMPSRLHGSAKSVSVMRIQQKIGKV